MIKSVLSNRKGNSDRVKCNLELQPWYLTYFNLFKVGADEVTQHPYSHCLETWTCVSVQLKWCNFPSFHPQCFSNWVQGMAGNRPIFFRHTLVAFKHAHINCQNPKLWKMRCDCPMSNKVGKVITGKIWTKMTVLKLSVSLCLLNCLHSHNLKCLLML